MIETIQTTNYILALGGVIAIPVVAFLVYDLRTRQLLRVFVVKFGLAIALVTTFMSTVLTLIYSEVFGIIPCGLCWLERIALYPQVLLLAVALYYKDTFMPRYGIALSVLGLVVSLYHHYIQMGGNQFIKCPAAGTVDCAKRFIFEFGFVTFPFMAAVLFAFLIALYVYLLKTRA